MIEYLNNLLPRLQQFSKTLDHLENFVDKPWILIDEEGQRHTYIFQRDKSLVMSVNGRAQIGKWDYIRAANSLLIDRNTDKILLNSAFVEKGLMVLRLDGSPDRPWILANEYEIPDLDIQRYMTSLLVRNHDMKVVVSNNKRYLYTGRKTDGIATQTVLYDENLNRVYDSFILSEGLKKYNVERGIVISQYYEKMLSTDKGEITVCTWSWYLEIGQKVLMNGKPAPDGLYKITKVDDYHNITVTGGRISSLKQQKSFALVIVLSFFLIVFCAFMYTRCNNVEASTPIVNNSQVLSNNQESAVPTVDTLQPNSTNTWSYSNDECKSKITSFLDAVNARDFATLTSYFPDVVPKYYTDKNMSSINIVKNIRQYWTETLLRGRILYDTTNMVVKKDGDNYYVETKQIQFSTNADDNIPMTYQSEVKYTLSSDLKITSVSGNIVNKGYDFLGIFALASDDSRSLESYISTASTSDFDRLFQRLASTYYAPNYKAALKDAILSKFGRYIPVYNVEPNYPATESVTLEEFCDHVINGTFHRSYTKNVNRSSTDALTSLDISYYFTEQQ